MVQSLWKTVYQFLKKISKRIESQNSNRYLHTMFIVTLFITAKR